MSDTDADGRVDPGEAIRFQSTLTNTGANDAQAIQFVVPSAPNLTAVTGSATTTPVALDDALTAHQDTPLVLPAPGILANDFGIPPPGAAQLASAATELGGTVTVNADGSLTYIPPPGVVSPHIDSFKYAISNPNGTDMATVRVAINDRNDAPSFAKGPDPSVLEDAGPQSVTGWATAILSGPANEAGQTVEFVITANSAPGLFSAGPAVSAGGDLTFTPAPNAFGIAIITIVAKDNGDTAGGGTDTSPPQIFAITITPVNDAPTIDAVADVTMIEDAPQQTINLTSFSDGPLESSATITITATSNNTGLIPNPAVNYASPATSGSLTFTPVANQSGTATITVAVMDSDGTANGGADTMTFDFTVTVFSLNDAPTLAGIQNPAAVLEDAGAQIVNLAGITTGAGETQTLTVTATSNNTALIPNPTVTYTSPNASGSLSYTPVANASGSAVITVTVTDDGGAANGGVDTVSQTFTVTVIPVNDPPTLDAISPLAIFEDAGAQTVNLAGITAGGGETQTLTVTAVSNNMALIPNPSVAYASSDATGSISFTPVGNQFGTADITVTVSNDGGTANGGVDSFSQTFTVTVAAVNDAPTLDTIANPAAILEDAGTQTASFSGVGEGGAETQTLSVTALSNNTALIPNPLVSYVSANATGLLSYTPVPDASGTATITVTVMDNGGAANGGVDQVQRTFTVNVTAVNDAPSFTKGLDQMTLLGAGAQAVDSWATSITAGPNEDDQTLAFTITGNSNPGIFAVLPSVSPEGDLAYTPSSSVSGLATITLALTDSGGTANGGMDTSTERTFTITVVIPPAAVADGPAAGSAPGDGFHVAANTTLDTTSAGVRVTTNDDLGTPTGTVTSFGPATGSEVSVVSGATAPTVAGGTIRILANGAFIFSPAPGFVGLDSFRYTISNAGGGSSALVQIGVGARPTVTNDVYPATLVGNIGIDTRTSTNFSVLTNDTGSGLMVVGGSSSNGSVTFFSDGRFVFTPNPGFTGTATVTYTQSSGFGSQVGTLSIPVSSQAIWFVDNNLTAAGDGRLGSPFNTLAAFQAVNNGTGSNPKPGHCIFVYESAINYTGGVTVRSGQKLIGQDATAPLATIAGVTLPVDALPLPAMAPANAIRTTITHTGNAVGVVVGTSEPVIVRGLSAFSSGADGIDCTFPTGLSTSLAIREVQAYGLSRGIEVFRGTSGTPTVVALESISASGGGYGIDVNADFAMLIVSEFSNITVTESGVSPAVRVRQATFDAIPGGAADIVACGNLVIGASGNGVGSSGLDLVGVAGALSFDDVRIFTDNGAGMTVSTPSGVNLNVGGSTSVIEATGGPALNLYAVTVDATFDRVSSTGSSTNGMRFALVRGAGVTVNSTSSAVTNSAEAAFFVDHGTAPIFYAGSLSKTSSGWLVDITDRPADAGNITLAGDLSATGSSTGIYCEYNLGGTFTFSGANKTITTTNLTATRFQGNVGAFFNFTGGGLAITTHSGTAFQIVNGGTFTVTGPGNKLYCTGDGNAISINLSHAGPAGITFDSCTSVARSVGSIFSSSGTKTLGRISGNSGAFTTLWLSDAGTVNVGGTVPSTLASTSGVALEIGGTTNLVLVGTGAGAGIDISSQSGDAVLARGGSITGGELDITTVSGNGFYAVSGPVSITGEGNEISSAAGTCFRMESANAGVDGITFARCETTNNAVARISNSTGTKSLGRIITSCGGNPGLLLANAGTVNVGGTEASSITATTGNGISISNTVLNLAGAGAGAGLAVTATDTGFGVNITSPGTVAITGGGLAITTAAGRGFNATTGTVTVTGAGNTINSVSGTALNVSNATIGADGLTFQSISSGNATAAADPVNGIFLNTLFGAGGLTVTGTGTAGSGGTIQSTTGHGIRLVSCRNVSLNGMVIQNITAPGASGIFGTILLNFSMDGCSLSNIGNLSAAPNDGHGVEFGSNPLFNSNIGGTIRLVNNTFTGMINRAINVSHATSTVDSIVITGNSITGAGGSGTSAAFNFSGLAKVTSATISNNTIVANSAPGAAAIDFSIGGNYELDPTTANLVVENNTISQSDGTGIIVAVRNSIGVLNARIANNTVSAPLSGTLPGIRVDSGNSVGNTTLRLNITGNAAGGSGGSPGIGLRKEGTDEVLNVFAIQNLSPSPATEFQTEDFVSGQNPASALGASAEGTPKRCIVLGGSNFVTTTDVP